MLDLLLIISLGFFGSFGHCVGMCGPLTVAFSLSGQSAERANGWHSLRFHTLLNLGRMLSYAFVGAGIGALGSVVFAGGQVAGVGSGLRQGMAIFTGLLLIWFALAQLKPDFLPRLPILHPLKGGLHSRLSSGMMQLSEKTRWWTPMGLGLVWGLIPCGFLYVAQIKAAETANLWLGAATMLAFGIGTLPMMLGVGVSASRLSADKRSQLFRLGSWITLTIGVLTLLRTGDTMVDYTGHGSLLLLILALLARPLSGVFPWLLGYRRVIGVGAYVLAIAHTIHMIEHTLNWNVKAVSFLLPTHQWGLGLGMVALVLMTPAALTSFDRAQKLLGKGWRSLHLLSVPALLLAAIHAGMIGSHYLGNLQWGWGTQLRVGLLGMITLAVLLARTRFVWLLLSLHQFYVPPRPSK